MDADFKIPRVIRKKTSIRIDEQLWADFVVWCQARMTSTCHVLEPLIYALLKGSSKMPSLNMLPNLELNLNVTREVARPRRVVDRDGQSLFEDQGNPLRCHVCRREAKVIVSYAEGWDKTIRYYCCGLHARRFKRMTSLAQGYPKISMVTLYRSAC